jgi:hypothetical protein
MDKARQELCKRVEGQKQVDENALFKIKFSYRTISEFL